MIMNPYLMSYHPYKFFFFWGGGVGGGGCAYATGLDIVSCFYTHQHLFVFK